MLSIIINRYQSCLVISSWKRHLVKKEMNFKLLLLACIAASIAVTQISAQCLCDSQAHNGGQDFCVTSSRVVQPTPVRRGRSQSSRSNLQQFSSVGDRCSCGNTVVEPAIRPPCRCNQRKGARISSYASEDSSTASGQSSVTSDSFNDCGHITRAPFDSANIYATRDSSNTIQKEYSSLLPADPISVSLAYRAAQRKTISVPEEKLSFGFKRIPANAASKKAVPNIPEEKLFTFDRSVVELQDTTCHQKHKKIEEEEEEEDEEDEEEGQEAKPGCGGLGYLNYKELGYYPQKHIDNRFDIATRQFDIESEPSPSIINEKESVLEIGNCGYKPGRIVDLSNQASTQKDYFNKEGLEIINRGSRHRDYFNNEGLEINRGSRHRDCFDNEGLDISNRGSSQRDYFSNEGVDVSNRGSSQRDYFNNQGLEFNLEGFI